MGGDRLSVDLNDDSGLASIASIASGRRRFRAETCSSTEQQAQNAPSEERQCGESNQPSGDRLSVDLNDDSPLASVASIASGRRRFRVDTCSGAEEQAQQGPSEERHVDRDESPTSPREP